MRIYKLISWLILIASVGMLIYLFLLPYEKCIQIISDISGYGNTQKLATLLTPAKFAMLRFTPAIGVILAITMLALRVRIYSGLSFIASNIAHAYTYIITTFRSFTRTEKLVFWLVILANVLVKGYYILHFTITYDEAWTFLNFTERGIISSMTYYAAPNNHILNSIFTNLFYHLPFLPITFKLRLPAFLISILFLIVVYVFSRRWLNHKVAILLLLTISFLTPELFYGFTARGYAFVILLSCICFFISIRLAETRANETRNLFYFSLCALLGFYTMPSFLYPYATFNIYLFVYAIINKRTLLPHKLIIWGIITVAGVVLLYAPVFAISGVKAVTANQYVVPISRSEVLRKLWPHMLDTFEYLFTYRYALFIVYVLLIVACFYSANRRIAIFSLWILTFVFAIPVLHSVMPFTRTWVYLTVPVLMSVALILQKMLSPYTKAAYVYIIGSVAAVIICITSYKAILGIEDYALKAGEATEFALNNNVNSVYVNEPLMDAYMLYTFKIEKKALECIVNKDLFTSRKEEIPYLIYKKGNPLEADLNTIPIYSNYYIDIYKNPLYHK